MKRPSLAPAFLLSYFLLAAFTLGGQSVSICREVLATGGGEAQLGDKKFEFTLGETIIQSVGNGEHLLTQGFHQPEICPLTIVSSSEPAVSSSVSVFPNPTTATLRLAFTSPSGQYFNLLVVNAAGQEWLRYPKSDDINPPVIDCSALPAGTYFLLALQLNGDFFFQIPFIKSEQ